jgi:D-psicose/D-tagatose/L-ribulose 3-epimerase
MPRFGCHAFVWIGEWNTETGNYAIARSGALGFDVVEIPLLKPTEFNAQSHRAALNSARIQPVCSLTLPKEKHLPFNPDGARQFLFEALAKTEEVGSQVLCGCPAYSLGVLTGAPPTAAERQTVVDVIRDVAAEAARRGIRIGLEPCNRYETYLYNSLADARDTIRAVGAANMFLHADTYHMNIEEEGFFKPLFEARDVLEYVHMSESNRGLVGSGTVNWDQVYSGLRAADFKGTLTLESFAAINPDLAAATCLWRPPSQSPEVIAREGLAFMRTNAEKYGLQ